MVRRLYVTLSFALAASCSFDAPPIEAGTCVEGQQATCSCVGRPGVQFCEASSTFGECMCADDANTAGGGTAGDGATEPIDPGSTGSGAGASGSAGAGS